MSLKIKDAKRFGELEEKARRNFLENSNFNPVDWLNNKKEKKEYKVLFKKFLKAL